MIKMVQETVSYWKLGIVTKMYIFTAIYWRYQCHGWESKSVEWSDKNVQNAKHPNAQNMFPNASLFCSSFNSSTLWTSTSVCVCVRACLCCIIWIKLLGNVKKYILHNISFWWHI